MARFRSADPGLAAALRQRAGAGGAGGRPLILAVGGIEPSASPPSPTASGWRCR
jgi:hypothetical protein